MRCSISFWSASFIRLEFIGMLLYQTVRSAEFILHLFDPFERTYTGEEFLIGDGKDDISVRTGIESVGLIETFDLDAGDEQDEG
jgi:hypothetical protein